MVSGTFVLTDTMQKSFNGLFTDASSPTPTPSSAARRSSRTPRAGGATTVPESLARRFGRCPRSRHGRRHDRQPRRGQRRPTSSAGTARNGARESVGRELRRDCRALQPARAGPRRAPGRTGPDEVAIDAGTASKQHYKVGDTVVVSTRRQVTGTIRTLQIGGVSFGGMTTRSASPASPPGTVKTAQAGAQPRGTATTRSRSRPSPAHLAERSRQASAAARARRACRSRTRAQAGQGPTRDVNEGLTHDPDVLLGFGGDRAARRRLRDLQHPLDHRRATRRASSRRCGRSADHVVRFSVRCCSSRS